MAHNYKQIYHLKIANVIFRVELSSRLFLFNSWRQLLEDDLKNFLTTPSKHDFLIKFTGSIQETTINLPHYRSRTCYINNLLHPMFFLSYLGKLARLNMLKHDYLLLHAAGVLTGKNRALLILGKSGSGKSTTLQKLVPPLMPLSDDEIIVSLNNQQLVTYPCPFNTKVDLSGTLNRPFPVIGVIFPFKGKTLKITKLNQIQALARLLDSAILPLASKKSVQHVLRFLRPLSQNSYLLSHRLSDNILEIITNKLVK